MHTVPASVIHDVEERALPTPRGWSLAPPISVPCIGVVALSVAEFGAAAVWASGTVGLTTVLKPCGAAARRGGAERRFNAQFYRLDAGATEMQPVKTRVEGLRQIVAGTQRMRHRMRPGQTGAAMWEAVLALLDIRRHAKPLHERAPQASQAILDATARAAEALGAWP